MAAKAAGNRSCGARQEAADPLNLTNQKMKPSPTQYILALARTFPCLEAKLRFWHPANFDADDFHKMIGGWSTSERHAAYFVLTVWNPGYARDRGWTFDAVEAVSSLDVINRRPILEWMARPYYP